MKERIPNQAENAPDTGLEHCLGDEALLRLRRAYHELEAYQLSDAHREAREELRRRLSAPSKD